MTDQNWKPLLRTPKSTVTKALNSPAFINSRERAGELIADSAALRGLADRVEAMDHTNAPLCTVADRVASAVTFLRAKADRLDAASSPTAESGTPRSRSDAVATPDAATAARERLLVAALHYLITPVDLVPDFHAGGYVDDALLLSWVFGVAHHQLEPYLDDEASR